MKRLFIFVLLGIIFLPVFISCKRSGPTVAKLNVVTTNTPTSTPTSTTSATQTSSTTSTFSPTVTRSYTPTYTRTITNTYTHTYTKTQTSTPTYYNHGVVTTLAGQAGVTGSTNGNTSDALFNSPIGIDVDPDRNIYVADQGNNCIRKIDSFGNVSTLAGQAGVTGATDGTGAGALFEKPHGVVYRDGYIYVSNYCYEGNHGGIRKINASSGVVTTIYSDPINGFWPAGIDIDSSGNVYCVDEFAEVVKIDTSHVKTKIVDYYADYLMYGVVINNSGNLYFGNRKTFVEGIYEVTMGGVISAFSANTGIGPYSYPRGMAIDTNVNTYVSEYGKNTILKVTQDGTVSTFAGSGTAGYLNATGVLAMFNGPSDVAIDSNGYIYVADTNNHIIRTIQ